MQLGLPSHVHYAICDSLFLFLDTKADRYCAVPRAASLAPLLTGEGAPDDRDPACRRLVAQGLLAPLGSHVRACLPTQVAVPRRSIRETGRARAPLSWRTTTELVGALLRAQVSLRLGRFDRTLDRLRHRTTRGGAPDLDAIIARSLAFADHRVLAPVNPICLRDSLALLAFLGDAAAGVQLVFGVQAKPFYAHCWVQTDTVILNDSAYFPSTLTPILRV